MNLYKQVTTSPQALLQFFVDTQYPEMINRAIGVNLVNSDVGEENLYNQLMRPDVIGSPQYNEVLNFVPKESVALSADANEVIRRLNATVNRPLMSQATPYFCNPNFTGPFSPEQQQAIDNGACNPTSGWTSENTNTVVETVGGILNTIFDWVRGGEQPSDNGNENQSGPGNGSGNDQKQDYTPWIFGGAALLIIIIVAVILYQKSKG